MSRSHLLYIENIMDMLRISEAESETSENIQPDSLKQTHF